MKYNDRSSGMHEDYDDDFLRPSEQNISQDFRGLPKFASKLSVLNKGESINLQQNGSNMDKEMIVEGYRELRRQQKDFLTKINMPAHLKREIFGIVAPAENPEQKVKLVSLLDPLKGRLIIKENTWERIYDEKEAERLKNQTQMKRKDEQLQAELERKLRQRQEKLAADKIRQKSKQKVEKNDGSEEASQSQQRRKKSSKAKSPKKKSKQKEQSSKQQPKATIKKSAHQKNLPKPQVDPADIFNQLLGLKKPPKKLGKNQAIQPADIQLKVSPKSGKEPKKLSQFATNTLKTIYASSIRPNANQPRAGRDQEEEPQSSRYRFNRERQGQLDQNSGTEESMLQSKSSLGAKSESVQEIPESKRTKKPEQRKRSKADLRD